MSIDASTVRRFVLTGMIGSLIVFAFAFFAHNRLYSKDLEPGVATEERLRSFLDAPATTTPESRLGPAADPLERALGVTPARLDVADRERLERGVAMYGDSERRAFVSLRLQEDVETPSEVRTLTPPGQVEARYAKGVVTVAWEPGAVNRVLAAALSADGSPLRLAFRIYRGVEGEQPVLQTTVPFGVTSWRDRDLPIAQARLFYEVWAVLLRAEEGSGGAGEPALVGAERSDLVTVTTPEHFTLELLGGDESRVELLAVVSSPSGPVYSTAVTVGVGDPILLGELVTGLALQSIEVREVDKLTTSERLDLTPDGRIVLDPVTQQPRMKATELLMPVEHMTVQLIHTDGQTRTLEVDLP